MFTSPEQDDENSEQKLSEDSSEHTKTKPQSAESSTGESVLEVQHTANERKTSGILVERGNFVQKV